MDCTAIWGNAWHDCERLLLSRSLIKIKEPTKESVGYSSRSVPESQVSFSKNRVSLKKDTMFSMDLSLLKIVESIMSKEEKAKHDAVVVDRIVQILEA
eukprot:CAMPEP_0168321886 /NCGR_PEP_ID=MMETSP0213-20121227/2551_1 /TAXON_ID=151035 /ORGANISM="Euplotes harpa, Strain FSP1.4" /LENGTH=97 /DNA_ID=CAMNT_0008323649 /DNA_START=331 /DNA_END=621 /DNA_ORIENTATION=-